MIARVWRGWAVHAKADALEAVLRTQCIPGILAKNVAGLRQVQLLRLQRLGETEFVVMMWLDDMDAVRALAVARGLSGDDYEKAIVPVAVRDLLRRCDTKAEHYEITETVRL